jgi:hypothetical protein
MGDLIVLFVLIAIVIGVAYALGRYVRQRGGLPAFPAASPGPRAPMRRVSDRETRAVTDWLLSQAFEQTGIRVADDQLAYQRIVEAAQKAIQGLKTQKTVTISLPFLTADASGPKHLEAQLSREVIEELVKY